MTNPYWVIHNEEIIYGKIEEGQIVSSSLEILTFSSEELRNEYLTSLGVVVEKIDSEVNQKESYKWKLKY